MRLKYDCYISFDAVIYHPKKVKLSRNVRIYEYAMVNFKSGTDELNKNVIIGENTKVLPYAKLIPQKGTIEIGRNCTIQYGCLLYGVGGLVIGNNTRIAAYTVVTPMDHIYKNPNIPIWKQGEQAIGIKIGNDVWIGNSVKILDGVHIEDGCVIGAGSVVNTNIPPYSVAVGIPARVIKNRKSRFSEKLK
jgi:acetyltransferase-like isoleucine patch superfamily enzyme